LQSDADLTTRRNPFPGFWQATITPSVLAPAPASVVALANATTVRPAMTIARPYTSSPFVDVADRRIRDARARPDARTGHVRSIPRG
jgi:hypothetical protein